MPPRKTASKKIPINIQRTTEPRLIDSKILRATEDKKRRVPHVVAWAVFLGFIVGGVVLIYFLSGKNPSEQDSAPQITVPKATSEEMTSPSAPAAEAPPAPVEAQVQKVEILDTPTGFLNMRSGPGTNNAKLGEVKPGDVFDLVGEDKQRGWYEIRWTATSTGWVTKQYSRIQE